MVVLLVEYQALETCESPFRHGQLESIHHKEEVAVPCKQSCAAQHSFKLEQ